MNATSDGSKAIALVIGKERPEAEHLLGLYDAYYLFASVYALLAYLYLALGQAHHVLGAVRLPVYEIVLLEAFYSDVAVYGSPLVVCKRFPYVAYKLCSLILVIFKFHDGLFNPQCLYLKARCKSTTFPCKKGILASSFYVL